MKALIQRVSEAHVNIEGVRVGEITEGLLVFLGIEKQDTPLLAERLLERLLSYRVFSDDEGKMNLSVADTGGGLLIVSQFTLVADTRKGLRPSFSSAASSSLGEPLYNHFLMCAKSRYEPVENGQFGADMQVSLVNDGPVTFLLEVS